MVLSAFSRVHVCCGWEVSMCWCANKGLKARRWHWVFYSTLFCITFIYAFACWFMYLESGTFMCHGVHVQVQLIGQHEGVRWFSSSTKLHLQCASHCWYFRSRGFGVHKPILTAVWFTNQFNCLCEAHFEQYDFRCTPLSEIPLEDGKWNNGVTCVCTPGFATIVA